MCKRESSNQSLSAALVQSDANYYRLGAKSTRFEGVDVLYMPEFLDIAAGCVALWKQTPASRNDAQLRVDRLKSKLRDMGASVCRIYDYSETTILSSVLAENRYTNTLEYALIIPCNTTFQSDELTLELVSSQEDWFTKLKLHQCTLHAPDGHSVESDRWVKMELHKNASGKLEFYLAHWKGQVCGTVGVMYENDFLRMKNLFVHTTWRGQGIGAAITQAMVRFAADAGYTSLGMTALAEGPALSMYKAQGASIITHQNEWVSAV